MSRERKLLVVRELKTRNLEDGSAHTYYLCADCESTIGDFLKVLKRRHYDTSCDRCGKSNESAKLEQRLGFQLGPLPGVFRKIGKGT